MAITPIHLTRVSNNMQATALLDSLRRNTLNLFLQENQLATGSQLNALSDNPVTGGQALHLTEILDQQNQILSNIQYANSFLSATDTAVGEVQDLLSQAQSLASEAVNTTFSQDQRNASAELLLGIINQLVTVGNRKLGGVYLFSGQRTTTQPFTQFTGGVEYNGDSGALNACVDFGQSAAVNLTGQELFGPLTTQIAGYVDLNPALTADTRLADMAGAAGTGIRKGIIQVSLTSPAVSFQVDLRGADTMGDVVDLINNAAAAAGLTTGPGGAFNAAINTGNGLSLSVSAGSVTVTDTSLGTTARDLGVLGAAAGTLNGADLQPLLTPDTLISTLFGNAGAALGSILITNGASSATVDLSGAATVQDILNRINTAGVGVEARINPTGTGIDIINRQSGTSLSVGEAGGNTATLLGIRSLYGGTTLSSLNNGAGVRTAGAGQTDLRITAADGTSFEVALTGARTVQDVLDRINAAATAAGAAVTASLVATGNGIQLQESSGGAGALQIERANLSPAIDDLGLSAPASSSSTMLVGADPGAREADSMFSALLDLHAALLKGDTGAITEAGERINDFVTRTARVHGVVGARAQAMNTRQRYTESAVDSSKALLSNVKDVDYAEAITRFQQAQTTLQANLLTGSRMMQLSLLDFIGAR